MTVLPPNQAGVFLLFGEYKGTARESGFWWVNPFYTKRKLSLRLHNLNGEKLKVNDSSGNPIDIAAVVVWRVEDTFAACFEVEDYIDFVKVQSDAALRHLASRYPYDSWEDHDGVVTLRGDIDVVSEALKAELQERLAKAGVDVQEARLSHLAYASEIAEAMLRRQQAHAIVAARTKIVEGAVGMVRMALEQISADGLIQMDEERKAAMVCNLLVVLCGETNAQPVVQRRHALPLTARAEWQPDPITRDAQALGGTGVPPVNEHRLARGRLHRNNSNTAGAVVAWASRPWLFCPDAKRKAISSASCECRFAECEAECESEIHSAERDYSFAH